MQYFAQNRRQKVFNKEALRLRRGAGHYENLLKSPLVLRFIFQFMGGLELCLGGQIHKFSPWRRD